MTSYAESLHPGWGLDESRCPCDVHFVEWLSAARLPADATVFHLGTGLHHTVGKARLCRVLGQTTSPPEAQSYIDLVCEDPSLAAWYEVRFGDVYTTPVSLLPQFDVVNLFHLGEHHLADYGSRQVELELLRGLTPLLKPDARVVFYSKSLAFNWEWMKSLISAWSGESGFFSGEIYKTLQFYSRP